MRVEVTRWSLADGGEMAAYASGPPTAIGTTVVLLHGIGMSHKTWASVQPMLSADCRVVSFDLPGFGVCRNPGRPYDVDRFGDAVDEGLDRLGVRRHLIVGHSMGAQFAVDAAITHPEQVAGIVLIGPVVDPARRRFLAQALDLGHDTLKEPLPVNSRVLADYLRGGPGWYLATLRAMFAYPIEERIAQTSCPAVVLRGEYDPIARHEWCLQLAAAAGGPGRLVTVPERSHVIPLTAPESVVHEVRGLLARSG